MEDDFIIDKILTPDTTDYGFNLLLRKYQEKVYWTVRKMVIDHDDTNDVVQDIFVKIWQNLSAFRADANLYTWIYRITTNETLNFLSKKKKRFFLPIADVNEHLLARIDEGILMDGTAIQLQLQRALLTLPEKQRLVFNMKYFDHMKFEDISSITDTTVGALKASYHHAVKKIEEYMNND